MADQTRAIDQDLIRALAALLDETGLTEIEVEQEGLRVRVARQAPMLQASMLPGLAPVTPIAGSEMAAAGLAPRGADPSTHPGALTSPMVGTAYRSAEPGGKPYVDVGSAVKAGETLLIIEAMKTMNQIPAPRAGTVVQILIEDGQPVEFGEPLMIIE